MNLVKAQTFVFAIQWQQNTIGAIDLGPFSWGLHMQTAQLTWLELRGRS